MRELIDFKNFKDIDNDHISENLSNMLFENLNYKDKKSISFFRSDFSRSNIINCVFTNNIFSRADFISAYIYKSTFTIVDFGSCLMKNSTFDNVSFINNKYHGVAIQYSYFKNCIFRDELIITNMYNNTFINCKFVNCKFEKSSLDNNIFANCSFENVDISECIAENLKFDNCELNEVFLGSSLWTTYLYKNTSLDNCKFKYRGKIVDIWTEEKNKFNNLKNEERYFEYLNTIIVCELYKNNIFSIFTDIISRVMVQNSNQRKNNLFRIFEMMRFYSNTTYIPIITYFKIIDYLKKCDWNSINFEERIIYESEIYKIERIVESFDFSPNLLLQTPIDEKCYCKFHLLFENSTEAKLFLENLFKEVNKYYFDGIYCAPFFTVISEEKGSIILNIASYAALVLLVSYVIKKTAHNIISIKVENAISQKFIKSINSSDDDLPQICESLELAEKYDFLSKDDLSAIDKISKSITIDNVLEIILKFLF